ncbi:MAG TPA: sulfur carrier protein ThiS [Longimicrobiales bacterium]|nr:sulfur carrier protein ThiS [Longimicrobiales bacterium]
MTVEINGERKTIPDGLDVAAMVRHLGLDPRMVVVERNRDILRREQLGDVTVAPGDRFELVHFVGGG